MQVVTGAQLEKHGIGEWFRRGTFSLFPKSFLAHLFLLKLLLSFLIFYLVNINKYVAFFLINM